jgi:hypothetical protein
VTKVASVAGPIRRTVSAMQETTRFDADTPMAWLGTPSVLTCRPGC